MRKMLLDYAYELTKLFVFDEYFLSQIYGSISYSSTAFFLYIQSRNAHL